MSTADDVRGHQDHAAIAEADLAGTARNGALGLAGAVVAAVGGFALTVVVGRGTDAEGAGLFFVAVAVFTIAMAIGSLGADTGLLRALSRLSALERSADLRPTVWIALVPVLVVCTAVSVAVLAWADVLSGLVMSGAPPQRAQPYLVGTMAFLVVGAVFAVVVQGIRGLGDLRPYVALQNLLLPLGRLLLVAAAVFGLGALPAGTAPQSSWSVPLAWSIPLVVAVAVAATMLRHLLRRAERAPASFPRRPVRVLAREFWVFALPRGGAAAVDLMLVWIDVILVGVLRSTAEAGIYAAASRFVTTGTLALQAMRVAIGPQLSGLLSTGQRRRGGDLYRAATVWVVLSSWPLYLLMACFPATLLRLLGAEFTAGSTALSILALGMLVSFATGNVGTVLSMSGKSGWALANKLTALVAMLVLDLALVPRYGMVGAAVGWTVAIAVDNLLALWQVKRLVDGPRLDRATLLAAGAAVVCFGGGGLGLRAALGDSLLALLCALVGGTAVYAAVVYRERDALAIHHLLELPRALVRRVRT